MKVGQTAVLLEQELQAQAASGDYLGRFPRSVGQNNACDTACIQSEVLKKAQTNAQRGNVSKIPNDRMSNCL